MHENLKQNPHNDGWLKCAAAHIDKIFLGKALWSVRPGLNYLATVKVCLNDDHLSSTMVVVVASCWGSFFFAPMVIVAFKKLGEIMKKVEIYNKYIQYFGLCLGSSTWPEISSLMVAGWHSQVPAGQRSQSHISGHNRLIISFWPHPRMRSGSFWKLIIQRIPICGRNLCFS